MATPVRSVPRPSALPASQNTAPVIEFHCLFTHDMRRKQKRWQDGYVKFHTFNSRIMAYNENRDLVGDTYWKESSELQEGAELTLERAGVLVEVTERMGTTQTDLTPLFESRKTNPSPQAKPAAPQSRPYNRPAPPAPSNPIPRAGSQLRHKSLNALLGASRGPIGKAAPSISPYESRHGKENDREEERAAKRQKVAPAAEILSSGPAKPSRSNPNKQDSQWEGASHAKRPSQPPQAMPRSAPVINLDSEPDMIASSDVTLPSPTPGMQKKPPRVNGPMAPLTRPPMMEPPQLQTPRLPKGRVPIPGTKVKSPQPALTSSPPVVTSNIIHDVDIVMPPKKKQKMIQAPPESPPRDPRAKALRLTTSSRRGMLLCQTLPQQPARARDTNPKVGPPKAKEKAKEQIVVVDEEEEFDEPLPWPSDDEDPIVQSRTAVSKGRTGTPSVTVGKTATGKRKTMEPSPPSSPDAFEDIDIIHGLMDRQMMVSPVSHKQDKPLRPKSVKATESKPSTVRTSSKKFPSTDDPVPVVTKRKAQAAKKKEKLEVPPAKKASSAPKSATKISKTKPPPPPPLKRPSPGLEPSKQNSPISHPPASPIKSLISTGGFKKKTKTKRPSEPTPMGPPPPNATTSKTTPKAATSTVSSNPLLPPHPLRANTFGPLMTTTELSALLQSPQNRTKNGLDPIEDASQQNGISPNRAFRRVRSENDAPIPSTSEAWEERNLAKDGATPDVMVTESVAVDQIMEKNGVSRKGMGKFKAAGLAALIKKTDPRKKFVRSASVSGDVEAARRKDVDMDVGGDMDRELVLPPVDTDVGPWSTEAFDLFDWRPPGRDGGEGKTGESEDKGIGMLKDTR